MEPVRRGHAVGAGAAAGRGALQDAADAAVEMPRRMRPAATAPATAITPAAAPDVPADPDVVVDSPAPARGGAADAEEAAEAEVKARRRRLRKSSLAAAIQKAPTVGHPLDLRERRIFHQVRLSLAAARWRRAHHSCDGSARRNVEQLVDASGSRDAFRLPVFDY